MASSADDRVALLSIHPRHAEAILCQVKRVEFRRVRFSSDVSHVVIYSTAPVQRVVGWFQVGEIVVGPPEDLWRRFAEVSGLDQGEFDRYFADRDQGVAIRVEAPIRLGKPLEIKDLGILSSPPQSFCYLSDDILPALEVRHASA